MENTAIALATATTTASDLNIIAEDAQFEDINPTVPSVTFLEANTSAISIEELTVNYSTPQNLDCLMADKKSLNSPHNGEKTANQNQPRSKSEGGLGRSERSDDRTRDNEKVRRVKDSSVYLEERA